MIIPQMIPVRVLRKQGRIGKIISLMEGFAAAQFDVLAMIDGDLQYSPEVLPMMLQQLTYAEIIVADRRTSHRHTNRLRHSLSNIFAAIAALISGMNTDMQSGLKMFRRKIYDGLIIRSGQWSFDLNLVTYAISNGYTLANIPIEFEERHGGVSKVAPLKVGTELLKVAVQLKVKWTFKYFMQIFMSPEEKELQNTHPNLNIPTPKLITSENKAQMAHYAVWLAAEEKYNNTVSY